MESLTFLKDLVGFVACEKINNSMLFYLLIVMSTIVLGGIFVAIPAVNDSDIAIDAVGVGLGALMVHLFVLENHLKPEKIRKVIELIEEDFLVKKEDFKEKVGAWQEIDALQKRHHASMIVTVKYIKVALVSGFFAFLLKNTIQSLGMYSWLTVPSHKKELPGSFWITPFLTYIPPEFDQPIFSIYVFTLQISVLVMLYIEGYMLITIVCLSTARVLVDFETIYILVDNFSKEFKDHIDESELLFERAVLLKEDMARIVMCHQRIIRKLRTCADNSEFAICCLALITLAVSCTDAFFILKATELRKTVIFSFMFLSENLVLFLFYQNGQRIFNENDKLRKSLLEVPWIDKPRWLRQAMHIMLTQASRDMQIKPYGIFALNYMSFKDLMKFTFSVGNVLYTKKQLASQ